MPVISLTQPELTAFKAAFDIGSDGLDHDRFVAVHEVFAAAQAEGDALILSFGPQSLEDARERFAIGAGEYRIDGIAGGRMLAALDAVEDKLGLAPAPVQAL